MKPEQQLRLTLVKTRVASLVLHQGAAEAGTSLNLNFEHSLLEQGSGFLLSFDCALNHKEGLELKLVFIAEFKTDKMIDEEFFNESFARVNAPAIAYPFLRAYIANLFVASGYDALMLPTVNFQAMANKTGSSAKK